MLGVQPQQFENGRAVLALDLRPELTNSRHVAHGAVVMAPLDCSMASASRSTVDYPTGAATIEMSVNFLNSATGRLTAEGRVLRNGKSFVFCEDEARDAAGELLAKALGTYKMRRRVGDDAEPARSEA